MSTNKQLQQQHLPKGLVLPYLILLRLLNALTISTYFQPDEYWQSLEPAHHFVYGYGHLTWEWNMGLRSFIHPLIFTIPYYISEWIGLEDLGVLYLPKILQAIIAGIGEYYFYEFLWKFTKNEKIARIGLGLSLVSAFNWYVLTRTFSNSFELSLISISLSYWCWDKLNYNDLNISIMFGVWSCLIRPTNALICVYLGITLLWRLLWSDKLKVILHVLMITTVSFLINVGIDYTYYGKLTIPLWNFIKFNAISSLSKFYGVAPWHFHIFQSLPIILMAYLPFTLVGFWKFQSFTIKSLVIFIIGVFSFIDHKEFRFLYPIQPFLLLFTAYGVYNINLHHPKLIKYSTICIILLNTLISIFFTQFNERGVIDVVSYLKYDPDVKSIGFLTPCHSTPWQSYFHDEYLDQNSWFLTCEPPLHLLEVSDSSSLVEDYKDESDYFYENPELFLFKNFPPPFNKNLRSPGIDYKYEWPTHLVFFESLEQIMNEYLKDSPYVECNRFFNSYFHWDQRRRGDVIVYCKWPWE